MGTLVFQATLGGSVNLIGPNTASTVNFTLPSADGTSGQALTTNGSGTLAFTTVTTAPGGSTTQVQYNNAGAFAGSANLTFNGTTLTAANTSITTSETLSYGTANGVTYLNGSKVVTSGSALVFDGTNFGIGTSSPVSALQVVKNYTNTSDTNIVVSGNIPGINIRHTSTGRFSILSNYSNTNTTSFLTGTGTNNPSTEVILIDHSTNTTRFQNTISVGGTTPSSSGAGITFPAAQSASSDANTLDDYEEGTWTPSLGGTAVYNAQNGSYIKIGQLVYVFCFLNISVQGTGSTTTVSGLPFNVRSSAADRNQAGSINFFNSLATSVVSLFCQPISSSTTVNFPGLTAASSGVVNPITVFQGGTQIYFSAVYQTNT
jgi:hypothetical protein